MTKLRKADSSKRRSHLNVTYYGYLVVAALVIALMPDVSFAEEITLTTILPRQDILRTRKGVVGNEYRKPEVVSNTDIGDNNLLIEGSVGIGTTGPEAELHLAGSDNTPILLIKPNTMVAGDVAQIHFADPDGGTGSMSIQYKDDGSPDLAITGGNVGIGTTSPGEKLHIAGSSGALIIQQTASTIANGAIRFQGSERVTQAEIATNAAVDDIGNLEFRNAGSTNMILTSGGNVGIGTTSPGAKLDVNGTAKIANWADQSLTENGYARVGSLLIQWGTQANYTQLSNDHLFVMDFPIPFPNAVLNVTAGMMHQAGTDLDASVSARVISNSQVELQLDEWSGTTNWIKCTYIAIGY